VSFAVDTNVLLRSIDDAHAAQRVAQNGLLALRNHGETLFIFPQNLIEFWAVATRQQLTMA
jgi:predicted nucleic-acid-binding protein